MQLTCTEIRQETADVNTYLFQSNSDIDFIPGQFLPLQVSIDGQLHSRCYSLASIPGDDHLALTIKRIDGGLVSNYLADHAKVGDAFATLPAAGEFHYQHAKQGKLLLLSAGCGITPVYSMLRQRLAQDADADIVFVHSASHSADRIFVNELEALAAAHPNLTLHWVISNDPQKGQVQGKLDARLLLSLATDIRDRTVLMCGPEGYMLAANEWFKALGVAEDKVFQEAFHSAVADYASGESQQESAQAGYTMTVGDRSVAIGEGQTVLEALESEQLPIFAACRSGVCGSCRCKSSDPTKVTSTAALALPPEDVEQGYFLACASTLSGDVEVSIG